MAVTEKGYGETPVTRFQSETSTSQDRVNREPRMVGFPEGASQHFGPEVCSNPHREEGSQSPSSNAVQYPSFAKTRFCGPQTLQRSAKHFDISRSKAALCINFAISSASARGYSCARRVQ